MITMNHRFYKGDEVRKVIVLTNITLDGVMQSPAGPDEDPRGGFTLGGWAAPYQAMRFAAAGGRPQPSPLLFGRWTYENFYSFWPHQTGNPFSEILNRSQKYVASSTLREPLPWQNSILLKGDVAQAVAELKAQPGEDLLVMGSGVLVQTLMQHNLVDRYTLLIHPLILGSGRKLFPEGISPVTNLTLLESKTTPNGVIIATYRAGEETV
jgi:dihydrofolate reductase